jgi:hypothetical protein
MRPPRFHDRDGAGLSEFFGFDCHKPSIERAKVLAPEAGVGDRIRFAQAAGQRSPLGAQSRSRAILVERPLSSMKIKRSGSSLGPRPNSRARPHQRALARWYGQTTAKTPNAAPATINPHSTVERCSSRWRAAGVFEVRLSQGLVNSEVPAPSPRGR